MNTILLNPGPVTLSAHVRQALLGPDLCHREIEFATLQNTLRTHLLEVYRLPPSEWAAILLTGSGTAAVEAMLTSLVPLDGKVLVLENGVYGQRMSNIAARARIAHTRLETLWLEGLDAAKVEANLEADRAITHVAVVQHETTSGRLNDLAPIAALCRRYSAELLIDGVSSFGAEDIDFAQWPIAACAATANKCLHGVPGTSFVVGRRAALAAAGTPNRSVYFDLQSYLENQDRNGTPFTQSVQTFYALAAALEELQVAGGWQARRALYRERLAQVRTHLSALGIEPLLPDSAVSCVLHAFKLPPDLSYRALHDALKAQGFVIYAGQSTLANQIFRISMMGEIAAPDVQRLCQVLTASIRGAVKP